MPRHVPMLPSAQTVRRIANSFAPTVHRRQGPSFDELNTETPHPQTAIRLLRSSGVEGGLNHQRESSAPCPKAPPSIAALF